MLVPVRVTGPSAPVVSLAEAKEQCRVDHGFEDQTIQALIDAATAHLDGWGGCLCRCIMPQTWRVEVSWTGDVCLPFPDVTVAIATYEDASTESLEIRHGPSGCSVTVAGVCTIDFDCQLPNSRLPAAQVIVRMLVAHWFDAREAAGPLVREVPMAAQMLINGLRWRVE